MKNNTKATGKHAPNMTFPDDLEHLKRMYTPKQLRKMWKQTQPKPPWGKTNFIKKLFCKHKYIWLIPMEDHYIERCLRCGKQMNSRS